MKYEIPNKKYILGCKLYYGTKDLPKSAQVKRSQDGQGAWVGSKGFGWLYVSNEYIQGETNKIDPLKNLYTHKTID